MIYYLYLFFVFLNEPPLGIPLELTARLKPWGWGGTNSFRARPALRLLSCRFSCAIL